MCKNWFKKVEVIKIESQVLALQPDDILVLSYPYNLSDKQFETLKKQWDKFSTNKHKVILLEGGGKLSILRL